MTPRFSRDPVDSSARGGGLSAPGESAGHESRPSEFARHLIAIGAGRGGVGKSVLSVNLAVYLAQLGKRVVLVDADVTGANLHTHFGLSAGHAGVSDHGADAASLEAALLPTAAPGLRVMPAPHDSLKSPLSGLALRKLRWVANLRNIPCDFLIINVGPGNAHFAVDTMLAADLAIAVVTPDPPSIETTYRFLRASFRRRMRRALAGDRFRSKLFERILAETGAAPGPIDLVRAIQRVDTKMCELAWAELQRLQFYLVVNQARSKSDTELGGWMSELAAVHYGVSLEELGHVEYDDAVWITVRRNRPLLLESPTSKSARNIERIARRVLAVATADRPACEVTPPLALDEPNFYALLGVSRSASDEEIRRGFKRKRDIYTTGGVAVTPLFTQIQLQSAQAKLDEAHDILVDPMRRQAYDMSMFADSITSVGTKLPSALMADLVAMQSELMREIGPDTEFTGALLRRVRESLGVEIEEVSLQTRIGRAHLEAIEDERFASLPALVYVRGFVRELARVLKLDGAQVSRTYMQRAREFGERAASGARL